MKHPETSVDETKSKVTLMKLLWPWLTTIPIAAFSLALILLFWTEPGQILESMKIGGVAGLYLPTMTVLPMMLLVVAHALFLIHVRESIYVTTATMICSMPWAVLLYFWVRLDGGSVLAAILFYFLPMAVTLGIIEKLKPSGTKAFYVTLSVVGCLLSAFVVFVYLQPIDFPRYIGAIPIIVIGLGIYSIALFVFFIFKRASWWVFAGLGFVLVVFSPTHDVRTISSGDDFPVPVQLAFTDWLQSRPDLDVYRSAGKPYPVIITSAEGGGITAAGHAYFTLMGLQENCPMFSQHIFASVGVSGGAYGTALFGGKMRNVSDQMEVIPCRRATEKIDPSGIAKDHFAPVVASFLFADIPNAFIPFFEPFSPTRAISLELSFEELEPDQQAYMRSPIESSWKPDGNSPALVFVAAEVSTGNRFQISPLYEPASWYLPSPDSVRVSSAAGTSARFPWITPSAALVENKNRRNLVDGGYFENSGADAAAELIRTIWNADNSNNGGVWELGNGCKILPQTFFLGDVKWGCNIPIHITYLAITDVDTRYPPFVASSEKQSFLMDPIRTMLATRTARGTLALSNAHLMFCQRVVCVKGAGLDSGFQEVTLPSVSLGLPLGWSLSSSSVETLRDFSVSMDDCDALERLSDPEKPEVDYVKLDRSEPPVAKNYNGCHLATMASLFNLEAFSSDYYGIEGWGYEFR